MASAAGEPLVRRIAALALPALGVLAAEPLYLLFDTAVIGRLGAVSLAGLAVGGLVVTLVSSQLTFLSYGTTARSARFHGAGDRAAAVREGVQATWLAVGLGVLVVVAVHLAAVPMVSAIGGSGPIADAAIPWLRIAIFAAPAILISLAGNGWMRGIQDTVRPLRYVLIGFGISAVLCPLLVYGWLGLPRWELAGSAVANLVGQWIAAALFCRALISERVSLRPDPPVLRAQVVMGRDRRLDRHDDPFVRRPDVTPEHARAGQHLDEPDSDRPGGGDGGRAGSARAAAGPDRGIARIDDPGDEPLAGDRPGRRRSAAVRGARRR